ncbi:MAG: histidinol-phosphatase, partial [Proteobacteria bacterium]
MKKIIFVDRDGTILKEPMDQQIDSLDKIEFVDGAIPALRSLQSAGWQLALVSNQDGLGTSSFPTEDFSKVQEFMLKVLQSCRIEFLEVLICPHFEAEACLCRKPRTGLVKNILAKGFDHSRSAVV